MTESENVTDDASPVPVVGIGASAGGLDAFKRFFNSIREPPPAAFVLVQHLDPDHKSMMVELLSRHTDMQVTQVRDHMRIEPRHVYMIPPGQDLVVRDGELHLSAPSKQRGMRMPIDLFLRSLAEDQRERAIAIILSGTGSDGTLGVKDIKGNGGIAMVQDPSTAQYDGMPRSAVATGAVDYVLPVEEMGDTLTKYIQHAYAKGEYQGKLPRQRVADDIEAVLSVLVARRNHDFRCYKRNTLMRRIQRRMGLAHLDGLPAYLELLRSSPDEVDALFRDFLIGVTSFFRDMEAWETLRKTVLPKLFETLEDRDCLRVWVAGCSSGEEAYTLAILLAEHIERNGRSETFQIFATDIDRESLDKARAGVYPENIAADINPDLLGKYFEHVDNTYRVVQQLRQCITFSVQNLVADPPFSKLDLICCRNLLIYLDTPVQERVIHLFNFALQRDGFLMLGNSETVGNHGDLFRAVSKKWRIYRSQGRHRGHPGLAFGTQGALSKAAPGYTADTAAPRRLAPTARELTEQRLLSEFAPSSALINDRFEVLYLRGDTDPYLQVPQGEPNADLLSMVREGIRGKLRSQVQKAFKSRESVSGIVGRVKRNKKYVPVRISLKFVERKREQTPLMLVCFEDVPQRETKPVDHAEHEVSESAVLELEQELQLTKDELLATKEELQNTIEEMETSNEELKASNEEAMSMNEELQSSNEELETSKEEMQSLNEELNTVNVQLNEKVDALESANNDLKNLMASTDIATVFLDTRLCIKRFTPAVRSLLNLLPNDVGRRIDDLRTRFEPIDIASESEKVLSTLQPVEQELHTEKGDWYMMRIVPYRTEDKKVEGVVLTFVDVTALRQAELDLAQSQAAALHDSQLRTAILDAVPAVVWIARDPDCKSIEGNRRARELLRMPEAENMSLTAPSESGPTHFHVESNGRKLDDDELPVQQAARGKEVRNTEVDVVFNNGDRLTLFGDALPYTDSTGKVAGAVAAFLDVTELRRLTADREASGEDGNG